jgi:hypothetical protein
MTPEQSRQIVGLFVAAYPGAPADEATVSLWLHALEPMDFEPAKAAALDHVRTSSWWPSIADFARGITEQRRAAVRREAPRMGRCDGNGWIPSGDEFVPCAACNPWLHHQWTEGDLTSPHRPQAPKDYVMPTPCRAPAEGRPVGWTEGVRIAWNAYAAACDEQGRAPSPEASESFAAWLSAPRGAA